MSGGMAAQVAMAGGIGDVLGDDAEQLDLIEADAALPLSPAPRTGKVGRPAGAANKRTAEFRKLFLSRYRSPVVALAEAYSRSPADLARELQMFAYDADGNVLRDAANKPMLAPGAVERAFKLQMDCAVAAAPYVEQRQPLAIETKGDRMGVLVMGDLTIGAGMPGDQLPMPSSEQYQRLIDHDPMQSDGDKSET
jgi:hypothetical protein